MNTLERCIWSKNPNHGRYPGWSTTKVPAAINISRSPVGLHAHAARRSAGRATPPLNDGGVEQDDPAEIRELVEFVHAVRVPTVPWTIQQAGNARGGKMTQIRRARRGSNIDGPEPGLRGACLEHGLEGRALRRDRLDRETIPVESDQFLEPVGRAELCRRLRQQLSHAREGEWRGEGHVEPRTGQVGHGERATDTLDLLQRDLERARELFPQLGALGVEGEHRVPDVESQASQHLRRVD